LATWPHDYKIIRFFEFYQQSRLGLQTQPTNLEII